MKFVISKKEYELLSSALFEYIEINKDGLLGNDEKRTTKLDAISTKLYLQSLKQKPSPIVKPKKIRTPKLRLCSQENCNRKHKAQGLCRSHYQRLKRGGDTSMPIGYRNKLSQEDAEKIRSQKGVVPYRVLAKEYNVDFGTIWRVMNHFIYK